MKDDTTNKRVRDESEDSDVYFPESKRIRVDSYDSGVNSYELNLALDETDESEVNSPELNQLQNESDDAAVNSIRDDLLDILEDPDTVLGTDRCYPAIQGLDSVIKSFEEEILDQPPAVLEVASGSGESQPDLGFLLEASDDELGLPPTISSSADDDRNRTIELESFSSEAIVFGDMIGFDDELPSYHSDGFGIGGEPENSNNNNSGEYVPLGGLFDYEPADYWEFTYKAESLPEL